MLGGLLGLGGVSGFLGASNRSANLLNISVVVCIMGLLLSFQFIGEVCLCSSSILPQQHSKAALGSRCHDIVDIASHSISHSKHGMCRWRQMRMMHRGSAVDYHWLTWHRCCAMCTSGGRQLHSMIRLSSLCEGGHTLHCQGHSRGYSHQQQLRLLKAWLQSSSLRRLGGRRRWTARWRSCM